MHNKMINNEGMYTYVIILAFLHTQHLASVC